RAPCLAREPPWICPSTWCPKSATDPPLSSHDFKPHPPQKPAQRASPQRAQPRGVDNVVVMLPRPRFRNHKITRLTRRPHFECLETRTLPSATAWPGFANPVAEAPAHATLDQAQDLGDLTTATNQQVQVVGQIGDGPGGAAEVDWYSFTLDNPVHVTLATLDAQAKSSFVSVLSLYTL